jgi:hypothetical protein
MSSAFTGGRQCLANFNGSSYANRLQSSAFRYLNCPILAAFRDFCSGAYFTPRAFSPKVAIRSYSISSDNKALQREIENIFYNEYRSYREQLVSILSQYNPKFSGTKGRLVRLAQKLIDRCIFVMFCEDMGEQLSFPPNALRDYLSELSKARSYDEEAEDAWNKLKELFRAMNEGKRFMARPINRFNGGLFADDAELDALSIPNRAFCTKLQGENETLLNDNPQTLLYFAARYNFGTGGRDSRAITLYTLGRIFEQSITELEALEAEVENRPSLTVISKRKRDGVYYTPEWVIERVVAETLGPRLDAIRTEVGWSLELEGDDNEVVVRRSR